MFFLCFSQWHPLAPFWVGKVSWVSGVGARPDPGFSGGGPSLSLHPPLMSTSTPAEKRLPLAAGLLIMAPLLSWSQRAVRRSSGVVEGPWGSARLKMLAFAIPRMAQQALGPGRPSSKAWSCQEQQQARRLPTPRPDVDMMEGGVGSAAALLFVGQGGWPKHHLECQP